MKCLVLAAGYGTRMQAVTGDIPKALIRLGGRTILDRLLDNLTELDVTTTLVTNQRFVDHFVRWQTDSGRPVTILNDGSTHAGERLGAVGDIDFALQSAADEDDLLIVAADNLLEFSLVPMVQAFRQKRQAHLAVWHNDDLQDQRRRGVVQVSEQGVVTAFREKPQAPVGHLAAAPLYLLPKDLLGEPARYLAQGGNPDAPGYLMEYLVQRHVLHAWRIPGAIVDVGNPQSYADARRRYGDLPE